MIIGQGLSLFHEDRRGEDQVVGPVDGMNVLVGYRCPSRYPIGCRGLEHDIALLGPLIGGKHHVAATHNAVLDHGAHRSRHLPKLIVGIGVLHPYGAFLVAKLTRHQAEEEVVVRTLQLTPTVDLHIIQIQCGQRVDAHAQIEA